MAPAKKELLLLLAATVGFGAAGGIFQSTFNNYLSEVHHMAAEGRGWLEFPRELPGFLLIFISGLLLIRLRESQIAVFAVTLGALGALGLGFLSRGASALVAWVMIWSLGDHILFAVNGPLGLKLARDGGEGRRLGQLGGASNLGTLLGVGSVFLLARLLGDRYEIFYLLAAGFLTTAAVFYSRLRVGRGDPRSRRMVFRREYGLFYVISALFGIRKQIFLVFGSWVLVSIYGVPVSTMALLYFVAATLGVILRPLLGDVIDWMGERKVLAADELMLLLVCLTYAFAGDLFPRRVAVWILYAAYVLDIVLFALRVARTTYLKKIARDPEDITPTISLGITIDHAVAMSLPVLSGYIWEAWGFRWVFLLAATIAVAGFFICLRIRVADGIGAGSGQSPAKT